MKKVTIIKGTKRVMALLGAVSALATTACVTRTTEICGIYKGRQVNYQPTPDVEINNYNTNGQYAGYGYGYHGGHELERMVFGGGHHMGPGGHGRGFGPGGYGPGDHGGRIVDTGTNTVIIGDGGYGYGDYGIPNYGLSSSATTLRVGPNSTVNPTAGTHLGNTLDGTTGYYRNYKTNSR